MEAHKDCIFIVDDDPSTLSWLIHIIRAAGFQVRSFVTGQEFLEFRDKNQPGCAILDLNLPDLSGIDIQAELLRRGDELAIVMISGDSDIPTAVHSVQQGAINFLVKPFTEEALMRCIEQALAADAERRARAQRVRERMELISRLSDREREVMQLIIAGQPNKIIADELKLSERTVEYHRSNLMTKLGIHSVAELMSIVYDLRPFNHPVTPPTD
jgi:FixJ family two-component response regulator